MPLKFTISTGAVALSRAGYGPGEGEIVLDNVDCTGNELSLFNCSHAGLGNHNCDHYEDAAVVCLCKTSDVHDYLP